jgi:hypothetical protein
MATCAQGYRVKLLGTREEGGVNVYVCELTEADYLMVKGGFVETSTEFDDAWRTRFERHMSAYMSKACLAVTPYNRLRIAIWQRYPELNFGSPNGRPFEFDEWRNAVLGEYGFDDTKRPPHRGLLAIRGAGEKRTLQILEALRHPDGVGTE